MGATDVRTYLNGSLLEIKEGTLSADLVGLIFNTIGVSDGISMGTPGMRFSLPSRDIIADFFIPCLSNCIQYDRAIEYVTLQGLSTLSLGFHNSTPSARIRMITGHQFKISDLNTMSKLFSSNGNTRINFNPKLA